MIRTIDAALNALLPADNFFFAIILAKSPKRGWTADRHLSKISTSHPGEVTENEIRDDA
jgi:hypothetical protein